ncbi:MAG: hypothetical protein AB1626_05005, partial [Candidatus Micrarchaeota archaeon]
MRRGQVGVEYIVVIVAIVVFVVAVNYLMQYYVYAPVKNQTNYSAGGLHEILGGLRVTPPPPIPVYCGYVINDSGNYELT